MKISSVVVVLLTRSFIGEVCEALNVTVTPGPVTMCPEGDNITLSCQVSQRKRASSFLVVRWLFSRDGSEEHLIVKLNMRKAKEDSGRYVCRVQEIRKHRNRWRASSNGTAMTELRVNVLLAAKEKEGIWRLLEDVYLCAVLICSIGLVCMFLFLALITCQYLQRKQRLKASYYLVKSTQNRFSSGEAVTSVVGSSPGLPRKVKRQKQNSKEPPSETPPDIPAKAPMGDKIRRPKLLKVQPRKVALPKITEESLTYAELELVKPQPENKAACTGTVYAQILFEEK
ncbi:hypothetical protein AAFF_G00138810 [Aldrovandia affinis]|uniref:Ig-like domain-containing protein n=1 Tax=Aldrovandia affinis TaxID=143900 RepID=A0AAD7TC05_9TELE|nr:hypothetical protein AAFF_G00138810 [Aldrovandia affinis]